MKARFSVLWRYDHQQALVYSKVKLLGTIWPFGAKKRLSLPCGFCGFHADTRQPTGGHNMQCRNCVATTIAEKVGPRLVFVHLPEKVPQHLGFPA